MAWTEELRRSRLGLDHRKLEAMVCPAMPSFEAYLDVHCQRRASREQGLAGLAAKYIVTLRSPAIDVSRERIAETRVCFDVSSPRYPFENPMTVVVSHPQPFSPHVHRPTGVVCIGEGWIMSDGHMLLARLVVHLMRVFNFDEPDHDEYGFDLEAAEFWEEELDKQPLDPSFEYPVVPRDVGAGANPERRGLVVLARPAAPSVRTMAVIGRRP